MGVVVFLFYQFKIFINCCSTYPEVAKRTDARKKKIDEIIANAVANNKQSA